MKGRVWICSKVITYRSQVCFQDVLPLLLECNKLFGTTGTRLYSDKDVLANRGCIVHLCLRKGDGPVASLCDISIRHDDHAVKDVDNVGVMLAGKGVSLPSAARSPSLSS